MPLENSSLILLGRLGVAETSSGAAIWYAYFKKVYEHLKGKVKDVEDGEAGSSLVSADRGLIENIEKIKDLFESVIRESPADERLMELTEAYQVLSDPETRRAYVQSRTRPGPASLVHYSVILQMLFGSEHFHDYVGTMRFKSLAAVIEPKYANGISNDLKNKVLDENEDLLRDKVTYLVGIMNTILDKSSKDLRRRAQEEAQGFSQGSTAPPMDICKDMLKTIGPIYKSNAVKLRPSRDQEQAVPQGYSTYQKEATVCEVCRKVFQDDTLTDREKKKRAKKLQKLGEILEKTGTGRNSGGTTIWTNILRTFVPS